MKRVHLMTLCSYLFLGAGVLLAGQIILFNKTGHPVAFSLKFFHKGAEQKMVIGDFKLGPREKTTFPQSKDLAIASPLKLKVHWPKNPASTTTKAFDREDSNMHDIQILERAGKLELKTKESADQKA